MPRRHALPALLLALPLGGCLTGDSIGPTAIIGGVSVILTGRTPVDQLASLVTGRDCSVVHVERREPWCATARVPPRTALCTRSLGTVDCWTAPPSGYSRQVADPPARPGPP
jgi:hypothetical protein